MEKNQETDNINSQLLIAKHTDSNEEKAQKTVDLT